MEYKIDLLALPPAQLPDPIDPNKEREKTVHSASIRKENNWRDCFNLRFVADKKGDRSIVVTNSPVQCRRTKR